MLNQRWQCLYGGADIQARRQLAGQPTAEHGEAGETLGIGERQTVCHHAALAKAKHGQPRRVDGIVREAVVEKPLQRLA
jgi:hypothetical protein